MLKILLSIFIIISEGVQNEKQKLREYMEFNKNAVRKNIKHVSTRWLSLGKSLEPTLKQWDFLESYFISLFDLDDNEESEDDDKPSREKR